MLCNFKNSGSLSIDLQMNTIVPFMFSLSIPSPTNTDLRSEIKGKYT